jgi:preprotein translocase subunit SecD
MIYYRLAGVYATTGSLANVVFLLGVMGWRAPR